MPVFPATLPALGLIGDEYVMGEQARRTAMSAPYADKVRRVTTAAPDVYPLTHSSYTLAQLIVFRDFIRADLAGGSIAFDMTDPFFGDIGSFRLVGSLKAKSLGASKYAVSIVLERLP